MKPTFAKSILLLAVIYFGSSLLAAVADDPIEVKFSSGQPSTVYVTSEDVVSVDAINELGNVVALKKLDDSKMAFTFNSDLPVQFEVKYSEGQTRKTGWYVVKKPAPQSKYDIAGTELSPTDNPVDHARDNNNRGDWYGYKRDPFSACSKLFFIAGRYRLPAGHPEREAMWKAAGFPLESPNDKQLFEVFKSLELAPAPKF